MNLPPNPLSPGPFVLPPSPAIDRGFQSRARGGQTGGGSAPGSLSSSEDTETLVPSEMRSLKSCDGGKELCQLINHPFGAWTLSSAELPRSLAGPPEAPSSWL